MYLRLLEPPLLGGFCFDESLAPATSLKTCVSAKPFVLLDSEPHLIVIFSPYLICKLSACLLHACSSIACRNNPSGLVGRASTRL